MFDNVGRKIQVISVIVLVIMLIASLVGAIIIWATLEYVDGVFWIGLGTLVGGAAMAVFSSLMLQGFSIIVESCEGNLEAKATEKKIASNNKEHAKPSNTSDEQGWVCPKCGKRNTSQYCSNCSTKNPAREAGKNEWKCTACGKINQNYVGTCGCGQVKP